MAKVIVTEKLHPVGPELLKAAGYEVILAEGDLDVVSKEIVDADAVIVRIMEMSADLLSTAKNLKLVNKHGVGYDNIDTEYCRKAGIKVSTTPNANMLSVAEHTFAMMLALAKNLIPISDGYKKEGFGVGYSLKSVELSGKTLGLIGTGRIGSCFAEMCRAGLGMKVVAYDPYASRVPEGVELLGTPEEVLRQADVVSMHCALTDETRKMINKETLALMKPSAYFINCARGPMVDEDALIDALKNGRLAGAGLDVTDPEPVPAGSELFALPNVIVTPHYANQSYEAALRVSKISAENVIAVINGEEPVGRIV